MSVRRRVKESTERIEPEVYLAVVREIEAAELREQDGKHLKAAATERAKSLGVDMKSYSLAMKLKKMGPDDADRLLRGTAAYCGWMQIPIGDQLDMFRTTDIPEPPEQAVQEHNIEVAKMAGHSLGLAGAPIEDLDKRYEPGSASHQAGISGWHDGQAVLAQGLDPDAANRTDHAWSEHANETVYKDQHAAGYAAGLRGENEDSCPYQPGNPFRHSWILGHMLATKTREEEPPLA